jgi:hypothetical protein
MNLKVIFIIVIKKLNKLIKMEIRDSNLSENWSPRQTIVKKIRQINKWITSFYFYYCCTVGTLWNLPKFLQCIIIEFTPFIILPYPIPGTVSQLSFFHFHTWVHNISTTFTLLHPVLMSSLLPLMPTPRQDLFYLPVLRKRMFLFV